MNIKIFFFAFSLNGTRERKKRIIMYNATTKNGKPFVINETRSSVYISRRLGGGIGCRKCDFTSLRHDDIFIFLLPATFILRSKALSFKAKRCASKELIWDFLCFKNVKNVNFLEAVKHVRFVLIAAIDHDEWTNGADEVSCTKLFPCNFLLQVFDHFLRFTVTALSSKMFPRT